MPILAQLDPTWIETLPDNLKSWGMILLLAFLVAQKLFPQYFPSVPVVNPPNPVPTVPPGPVVTLPPSPVVVEPAPVVISPVERPIIDAILKLLPTLLPLLLPLLLKAKEEEEREKVSSLRKPE